MTIFDGARLNNYMSKRSDERKILNYIHERLHNSMLGYQVNGNPMKRTFMLLDIARTMLIKMSPRNRRNILRVLNQENHDQ